MDEKRIFSSKTNQLPKALAWIREQLKAIGCDETGLRKIELASEEAIVNIMRHAYKEKEGKIELWVRVHPENLAEITLIDAGPPFNPLHHASNFDPLATLEERQIGGLGLLFIRQYMDEVRYARRKNENVLTLLKKINRVIDPSQSK